MPKPTEPKIDPEELARPTRDPALKAAAIDVTTEAGEPLSWRIQPDGTLTVILPSGKKINRPMPPYKPAPVTTAKPGEPAKTPTKRKAKKK